MADRFVLPARKRATSNNPRGEVIRISTEAYNLLVEMGNESVLPMKVIASEAIAYAYEHLTFDTQEGNDEPGKDLCCNCRRNC